MLHPPQQSLSRWFTTYFFIGRANFSDASTTYVMTHLCEKSNHFTYIKLLHNTEIEQTGQKYASCTCCIHKHCRLRIF